jgi:dihydroorotase
LSPSADRFPCLQRIDTGGQEVMDLHVHCHFRGRPHLQEDFQTGSAAAAACFHRHDQQHAAPDQPRTFRGEEALVAPSSCRLRAAAVCIRAVEALAKAGRSASDLQHPPHQEVYPYISELGVLDHGILYELYEATRDVSSPPSSRRSEWCGG